MENSISEKLSTVLSEAVTELNNQTRICLGPNDVVFSIYNRGQPVPLLLCNQYKDNTRKVGVAEVFYNFRSGHMTVYQISHRQLIYYLRNGQYWTMNPSPGKVDKILWECKSAYQHTDIIEGYLNQIKSIKHRIIYERWSYKNSTRANPTKAGETVDSRTRPAI